MLPAAALPVLTLVSGCGGSGPGEDAAGEVVQAYLDAKVADGCGHYAYYAEDFARAEHVDVKQCQSDESWAEGEYFEYDIVDVRADGDRAEVDVEDESDAPRGPFTVELGVEDGEWRITALVYAEDEE